VTKDQIRIAVLEAKVGRLEQEIRVYEAHVNLTCERCGREIARRFNGDEYHLNNNSPYCELGGH
jgi:hypothetical protein